MNANQNDFFSLPSIHVHSGHSLSSIACGLAQQVYPLVAQKPELVLIGIRGTGETNTTFSSVQGTQQRLEFS